MKVVTKFFLCALVSIGLACTTHAKPDDEKQKKDEVEVIDAGKTDKKPYAVPDVGSTAALLGLSLALLDWRGASLRNRIQ